MEMLLDPLFHKAWLNGLCLSIFLPLLGLFLRLREEWLAALGLAQMSAASGLIGLGLGLPIMAGGALGAILMALIKQRSRGNNTAYALMLIAGWSLTFLVAANTALGESLGHALMNGQLYFVSLGQSLAALALLCVGGLFLLKSARRLLRARLFPHYEQLNHTTANRWHLGFDLLVAAAMAIATASIGLMTAFAMVFVPAWLAFQIASSWQQATLIATAFGVAGFALGFSLAIVLDQPYGPSQVAVYLVLAGLALPLARTPKRT